MARNPRHLAVLAVVLLIVAGYFLTSALRQPVVNSSAPAARPAAQSTDSKNREAAGAIEPVNIEQLRAGRPDPVEGERNPFRFGRRTEVAPPPRPTPTNGRPAPSVPAGPPAPAPLPAPPPGPPSPPPIGLKFIGIVDAPAQGGKLAVLSDGRSVFHGHEGDVIDGRFKIVRIGVESIEMMYVDGRGRQTIRLSGQ